MSAQTSLGFPFPTNSDDVDVPGDMSSLAAAIDAYLVTLLAGAKAYHAEQSTDEAAITSTTYTAGSNVCGLTFVAPPSGSVTIWWSARLQTNTAGRTFACTAELKTGSSINSGSVISAAADNSAIETSQAATDRVSAAMFRHVQGLTAGASYNVVTMHRVINGAGNGDIYERALKVVPDLSI